MRRRPAIAAYSEAPATAVDATGIYGLHTTAAGALIAVSKANPASAKIYRIANGAAVDLSPSAQTALAGTQRPTIAETEALLVFAAGGAPQKLDIASWQSDRLGGSPPDATHVIANSSRLLLNHTTIRGRITYSDQAAGSSITGHETWDGSGTSGFFSGEARPDPVAALHENTNEVFGFGTTNVQSFAPDPTIVYATVTTRELGCSAPYSVIKADQRFAWLDHQRRFVVSDGRAFEVLSGPIQQTLHDMSDTSDVYGYRVHHGAVDCLVWTFPTDGRTFAYQMGGGWSEWLSWNDVDNNWAELPITAHVIRPDTGENVVGTSSGQIGVLRASASDDLGARIVAHVTTGFVHRGTDRRKHCKAVRFVLKRGFTTGSTAPVGFLSYRDDYGPWQPDYPVNFGAPGDYAIVEGPRSCGIYRRREWRFTFSGSDELVLVQASEEFDVLDS